MSEEKKPTGLELLRRPFPKHQISKLPKNLIKDDKSQKSKCSVCGGWHVEKVIHLDYVGHAALTDRLLEADPSWTWNFVATDSVGNPVFDKNGGFWIDLTVCGVTRKGYGHADGGTDGDSVKEAIGDALRNAAMRFGAALDLWHKGDLHGDDQEKKPINTKAAIEGQKIEESQKATTPEEAGEYTIQFGKKFTGKKVKDIAHHDHESMLRWLAGEKKKGKTISKSAQEYEFNAELFLSPDRDPKFNSNEEIPF